ncbi:LA_2272 family surface repeat-containing protein [Chryseobacterium sp.]|uniref:LA_2272 family surface repeat-containing protein n=1 Tax=Chryseobacterium sp. TaxID=1871047 RepID=UPI002FC6F335
MKTISLIIGFFLWQGALYGQDSLSVVKNKIISLTPLNGKVKEVNGIAIGLGGSLLDNHARSTQKINGFNLEPNPLGILIWMFKDPSKQRDEGVSLIVNGLTISSAGYDKKVIHHGVSISLYNYGQKVSGVSVAGWMNFVDKGNGVLISVIGNDVAAMKGLSISGFNASEKAQGVQIGLSNYSNEMKGVQIGILNRSKKIKGLQIGIWNKNHKRSLPLINF